MTQEEKYRKALLEARAVLEPCLKYSRGKVREALDSIDEELKSFESEDERIIKLIRSLLENARNVQSNTSLYKQYDDALAWLEKQKERVPENKETGTRKEQKPAECEDCAMYLSGNCIHPNGKCENVKSRQEWSEEDQKMIDCIINVLASFPITFTSNYNGGTSISYGGFKYQKEMDWLKSLRPSWKPSEEQMTALEAATVRYQSTGLNSLYEDLKKL